jgi:hypothetical protein
VGDLRQADLHAAKYEGGRLFVCTTEKR